MHDAPRTLHSVREDAFNYVWDNAIEPALEVEPGAVVELYVRDASDEQIRADSGPEDVTRLDFDHVNPVSGPVFVKGSQPGDVLAVELLEFRPPDWGWTALIPGFGLLADEFPEPWLRISRVDGAAGRVAWSDEISLPYRPFPGTIGVAPAEPGQHPILPPSRWGGNLDTKHLVVGSTAKNVESIERPLEQIEGLGKSLELELLQFAGGDLRRNIAKPYHWFAALSD